MFYFETRFDVTKNFTNFIKFFETKQGPMFAVGEKSLCHLISFSFSKRSC